MKQGRLEAPNIKIESENCGRSSPANKHRPEMVLFMARTAIISGQHLTQHISPRGGKTRPSDSRNGMDGHANRIRRSTN
jgi:hypothetical protein